MVRAWQIYPTECRIFLTVWIVYLIHLAPVTGFNENRYLDLVRSIVDEGRFEIDTYHYNTLDKSYRDGHYYAGAAPGPALLAVPAYMLFRTLTSFFPADLFSQYDKAAYIRGYLQGQEAPDEFVINYPFGRFLLSHFMITALTSSLLTALVAMLIFRFSTLFITGNAWPVIIALTYAFGTLSFYYSTRLYAHLLAANFAFIGFAILAFSRINHTPIRSWPVFGSGLCVGIAILTDYAIAPVVTCIGLYIVSLVHDRRLWYGLMGGFIPVAVLFIYHTICFGGPFTTAYAFPNGPVDDGIHKYYDENFHGFSLPPLNQIWGLTFGTFRGIFWYIPVALPCLAGLYMAFRKQAAFRREWILIGSVICTQFVFNAMMHTNYWIGGWEFGPRFLTPMIPFLILPLVFVVHGRFQVTAVSILIVVSVLINWAGTIYGPSNSIFGALTMFLLSGPSTPLYLFISDYLQSYTTWSIRVSPYGSFMILGSILYALWRYTPQPVKE